MAARITNSIVIPSQRLARDDTVSGVPYTAKFQFIYPL